MNNTDVPIWEKYTLTIEEASKYFRIGEKKLRKLARSEEHTSELQSPEAISYAVFCLKKMTHSKGGA